MGIKVYIRPEQNLNIFVHTGQISNDEFITFYRQLFQNASFDPLPNQLVDLRAADSTSRSPKVLQMFADVMQARVNTMTMRPKVAIIAPNDLSFGLARMYEAFASSVKWDFVVFRTMDVALAWLGFSEEVMRGCDTIPSVELDPAL